MSQFSPFRYGTLALLAAVLLSPACGSRNIYKNVRLDSPALNHSYVHSTRTGVLDAGKEPVEFGGPAVSKETVFVASESRGVEALERSTFRRKWMFTPKNGVSSQLLLEGNVLYFGANDGWFYAVDADFGKVIWKYEIKNPVFSRATVTANRVFVNASDDVIYCLDRATGKWVWHYKRGTTAATTIHGNSTPLVDGARVLAGFSDGYFVALNVQDGNLQWEQKLHKGAKFSDVDASAVIDGDNIYIPSYDGELYVLRRSNGQVAWHVEIGSAKKVLIDGGRLYLASSDGHIYCLNKESGKITWKFELDSGTPTNLVQYENYLAFGSSQQYFYAIYKGDGSLAYRYNSGLRSGFVSTPAQLDKDIYVLSDFGNLHVFTWMIASARGK